MNKICCNLYFLIIVIRGVIADINLIEACAIGDNINVTISVNSTQNINKICLIDATSNKSLLEILKAAHHGFMYLSGYKKLITLNITINRIIGTPFYFMVNDCHTLNLPKKIYEYDQNNQDLIEDSKFENKTETPSFCNIKLYVVAIVVLLIIVIVLAIMLFLNRNKYKYSVYSSTELLLCDTPMLSYRNNNEMPTIV